MSPAGKQGLSTQQQYAQNKLCQTQCTTCKLDLTIPSIGDLLQAFAVVA
jgi:hypothetical protein